MVVFQNPTVKECVKINKDYIKNHDNQQFMFYYADYFFGLYNFFFSDFFNVNVTCLGTKFDRNWQKQNKTELSVIFNVTVT